MAAIDVDSKEAGPFGGAGGGAVGGGFEGGGNVERGGGGLAEEWPDDFAVGLGEGEGVDLVGAEPIESSFSHVFGLDPDRAQHAVDEHEPVAFALELLLADEADKVEAVDGDVDPGFFQNFALSALGGRLAQMNIELAADGAAKALVGGFEPPEQEDPPIFVAKITQTRDAVRQGGGGTLDGVVGHGGEDISV